MKNGASNYVEVKRVTWSKDSHGLFDYESKSVNFIKDKISSSAMFFTEGNEIKFQQTPRRANDVEEEHSNFLFSIQQDGAENERFFLRAPRIESYDSNKQNLFLIVRSLKNEEGVQRGYPLELGDILRLGRIEFKVIEYQDHELKRHSLFEEGDDMKTEAYNLSVKVCTRDSDNEKPQCKYCLMDESEVDEALVNPCNCKGSSGCVHMSCLQKWINSKVKNKVGAESSCWYWKHLSCEVCKTSLPDMLDINGSKVQLVPTCRPETPYMLLERIFYDRTKGGDNSKMLILLSMNNETHQIKLGRGHDCDLRENDISVSRLHAYIKYQNSKFVIVDNNSKFGTLILLRNGFEIEKKKIALQLGRTVITFSLKQQALEQPKDNLNIAKNPMYVEKHSKWQQKPKGSNEETEKEVEDFNLNPDVGDFE